MGSVPPNMQMVPGQAERLQELHYQILDQQQQQQLRQAAAAGNQSQAQ